MDIQHLTSGLSAMSPAAPDVAPANPLVGSPERKPNLNAQRAILLLNLGGPTRPDEVRDFLFRLFEDPEIIRVKWSPLRRFIAWTISTLRFKTSQ